jgi:hypothetical protein
MFIMYLHDVVMHAQAALCSVKTLNQKKGANLLLKNEDAWHPKSTEEDYTDESLSFSPHLNRWQVYVNSIILIC